MYAMDTSSPDSDTEGLSYYNQNDFDETDSTGTSTADTSSEYGFSTYPDGEAFHPWGIV